MPFQGLPEFYASYKLLNEKNHHVYSDKFSLRMLDLTCIHLATQQDIACHLDRWARLFQATTWEEIKMIAKHHTDLIEASETLFTLKKPSFFKPLTNPSKNRSAGSGRAHHINGQRSLRHSNIRAKQISA
ncbi:hypothetical protein C823_007187 [Eubacterium plexicaudatum ASF492]|uniref:Uncharacterized protein n=1 Tax=Eubacterium plexicaudatum ASF492 TaxID=1235802 RepID=N2ACK1_9FIRM|nr:hypothetical protein C823_007187 [Eubacterium plexicaudatum ASF492]